MQALLWPACMAHDFLFRIIFNIDRASSIEHHHLRFDVSVMKANMMQ
jgi:hypothetical protein